MRRMGKLKAVGLPHLKAGTHSDGGNLYLQVSASGSASWVFRFWVSQLDPDTCQPLRDKKGKLKGKLREMGLGSTTYVSLAEARESAAECRRLWRKGIDPIEHRRIEKRQAAAEWAKAMTFDECRDAFIASNKAGWKNTKHRDQWLNTLQTYATPVIGAVSVQQVDTAMVMKILEPIWTTKTETATRVRQRIEKILDWAKARGYRSGENPAVWRGHVENLLPKRSKVRTVIHHPALPYADLPVFMAKLRTQPGVGARALEFTVATVARSGQTFLARWPEFDLKNKLWICPADHMKGRREHRVPLNGAALAVLEEMRKLDHQPDGFVFPGAKPGRGLSNMAMDVVLRRMKGAGALTVDAVPHGFRATFKTWASEQTNFARELAEVALAHDVGDATEQAYQRGDLLDKRRRLMDAWGKFASTPPIEKGDKVVALHGP
ncbi:MAG TPA: integrase arm-type DNA-binding domain-containing protein [Xanthobacteraceae bacterium]